MARGDMTKKVEYNRVVRKTVEDTKTGKKKIVMVPVKVYRIVRAR